MESYIALIIILLMLLGLGQRIAFSLGIVAIILIYLTGISANIVPQTIYSALDNFVWAAIPLFVIMGETLVKSEIAEDMYKAANTWVRHIPGGLGVATTITCALFAAVSGTSIGSVAALGGTTVPEMIKAKYDKRFAYGCLACGGTLGILIPPSITMIIYGVVTEVSIEKLFIAGVLPGILLTILFSIYCMIYGKKFMASTIGKRASWTERAESSRKAMWGLSLIVIVLGGIYAGVFTVTESAGIGATYSILISLFIYKKMNIKMFYNILKQTVFTSTMIFVIVSFAMTFASALNSQRVPQMITTLITNMDLPNWAVILLFNVILLILGTFLDVPSIMLITLPIMYPIIVAMGYDPLWFAVLMTMNMEVATITPPVGLNLYVLKGVVPEARIEDIVIGSMPFVMIILIAMIIVALVPCLSTWLPSFVG